jgi:hypothetical protein
MGNDLKLDKDEALAAARRIDALFMCEKIPEK